MNRQTKRGSATWRTLLAALVVAGVGLQGMALYDGITTLTDPTTTYASWTRLPGDRALWLANGQPVARRGRRWGAGLPV